MREFKFRAWNGQRKTMFLFDLKDLYNEGCEAQMSFGKQLSQNTEMPYAQMEIMQFTGLKDGNGKGIYEGDILGADYEDKGEPDGYGRTRLQVAFQDGSFGWIGNITGKFFSFASDPLEGYEILGNIYENPEILQPDA